MIYADGNGRRETRLLNSLGIASWKIDGRGGEEKRRKREYYDEGTLSCEIRPLCGAYCLFDLKEGMKVAVCTPRFAFPHQRSKYLAKNSGYKERCGETTCVFCIVSGKMFVRYWRESNSCFVSFISNHAFIYLWINSKQHHYLGRFKWTKISYWFRWLL